MRILVKGNNEQFELIQSKVGLVECEIVQYSGTVTKADLYIDFGFEEEDSPFLTISDKVVLVNNVIGKEMPAHFTKFNGWRTFAERTVFEIASTNETALLKTEKILQTLGWKYFIAPNEPGFIAARTVAMIVNEAYFALEDEVSSKNEIDTAMKLGTNYPYGPFEWSEKIGLNKIAQLLVKLSKNDKRYTASLLLLKEANL